jgi:hypothetical protein
MEYTKNSASVGVLEGQSYTPRVYPSKVYRESWPYSSAGYGYGGS